MTTQDLNLLMLMRGHMAEAFEQIIVQDKECITVAGQTRDNEGKDAQSGDEHE